MDTRLQLSGRFYRVEHMTTNRMSRRSGKAAAKHRHPVFHLIYITGGRGEFVVNSERSGAEPGMLYVINPNEWHEFSGEPSDPLSDLECTFSLLDVDGCPAEASFFDLVQQHRNVTLPVAARRSPLAIPPALQPWLIEGFQRLLETPPTFYTADHTGLTVMDLLYRLEEIVVRLSELKPGGAPKPVDLVLANAKQYLHVHLAEQVKLSEIAAFVHLTPNYLCRIFKEHTGESPMAYLQNRRMLEAQKLLTLTDLPIQSIAQKIGHEDASYFARMFRQHTGVSPQKYRQAYFSSNPF